MWLLRILGLADKNHDALRRHKRGRGRRGHKRYLRPPCKNGRDIRPDGFGTGWHEYKCTSRGYLITVD